MIPYDMILNRHFAKNTHLNVPLALPSPQPKPEPIAESTKVSASPGARAGGKKIRRFSSFILGLGRAA